MSPSTHQHNISYKHKIIIGFVVLVSMFEAIVIIYDVYNVYQLRQTFLHQRSQLVSQTYSQALRVPVWNLDKDTAENILKSILLDPDIIKVSLNYQQNALPAIQFSNQQNLFSDTNHFTVQKQILEPVVVEKWEQAEQSNTVIASLQLTFSKQSLDIFLSARKTEGLIQFSILLLCNLLLAYLLINWITSPLVQMAKSIRRLANNELDIHIPISQRNDEIDQVAHSVTILQKNNIELDELRSSMENKIKEQTKDLILVLACKYSHAHNSF